MAVNAELGFCFFGFFFGESSPVGAVLACVLVLGFALAGFLVPGADFALTPISTAAGSPAVLMCTEKWILFELQGS